MQKVLAMSKSNKLDSNIQTKTTGRLTPCLQKRTDKTTYLVEVRFSKTSTQNVEDKLKRVILHDLAQCEQVHMGTEQAKKK